MKAKQVCILFSGEVPVSAIPIPESQQPDEARAFAARASEIHQTKLNEAWRLLYPEEPLSSVYAKVMIVDLVNLAGVPIVLVGEPVVCHAEVLPKDKDHV